MNPFLPSGIFIVMQILLLVTIIVLGGFGVCKTKKYNKAIILAWLFVFISISVAQIITYHEKPGLRMIALIVATLFSMKIVVCVEWYKGKEFKLTFIQWVSFVVGWFGMKPSLFETVGSKSLAGGKPLVLIGISRVAMGVCLLFLGRYLLLTHPLYFYKIFSAGLLLAGLSLILHFGILNISAGMWRFSGADTRTLFKSPLLSTSLTEFWGKRWNLAFSEMTSIALYRPLRTSIGPSAAMITAFIFSGLLHELAISVPVKAGYGLPLLYFFIHGMVMYAEKGLERKGFRFADHKLLGRIWVIVWLVAPIGILFHKQFIKQIILPSFI